MEQHSPPSAPSLPKMSASARSSSASLQKKPDVSWLALWKRFRWTTACALYALLCLVAALSSAWGEKTFAKMSYVSLAFMQFLVVFFFFFYQLASFSLPAQRLHLRQLRQFQLRRWLLGLYLVGGALGVLGLLYVWGMRAGWF